ncbi:MAG: hypothetical protein R2795_22270 [Saprospiraceae bacterium]
MPEKRFSEQLLDEIRALEIERHKVEHIDHRSQFFDIEALSFYLDQYYLFNRFFLECYQLSQIVIFKREVTLATPLYTNDNLKDKLDDTKAYLPAIYILYRIKNIYGDNGEKCNRQHGRNL